MKTPSVDQPKATEADFTTAGWKHPYVIYILLTTLLFGFLIFMGWLAWSKGWVPTR